MKPTLLRARDWYRARRFNFFSGNILLTIILCFILSLTPFSPEGSYFAILVADLIISWTAWDFVVKSGKKNTVGKEIEDGIVSGK
jgi:hypothetical protein